MKQTLQRRLISTVAKVATVAVALSTTVILIVLHERVHHSTDALLLQMAQQDAADVLREADQPVHVHDSVMSLPITPAAPAHRYALVTRDCEVVAKTRNVTLTTLPESLCKPEVAPGEHRRVIIDGWGDGSPDELRVVLLGALDRDGEPLTYITAVDHSRIDAALWGTTFIAIPSGIAVVLLIVAAAWLALRPVTEDLRHLAESCDALAEGQVDWRRQSEPHFTSGDNPTQEVDALAGTLNLLMSSIRQSFETQARFIATASHELRTPLTALVGELEVALRRERSADEYRETLQDLSSDAARLVELAEHLLAAARVEASPSSSTDVTELIQEALDRNAAVLAAAGLDIEFDPPKAPASVVCHRLSMGQVLDNLLQNASIHSEATTLSISVETGSENHITIRLEDDGVGIADELKPHLFRPFQRGLGAKGHGLGLYICSELMAQQGGAVTLDDAPGASWRLTIPAWNG